MPAISLPFVGEYSMKPKYRCEICGELLWTQKSRNTGFQEWLFTEDDRRHFKSYCNIKPTPRESEVERE